MKIAPILFFLFFFGSISAQNLVLNPSFENNWNCPHARGQINKCYNWAGANLGTTDYFNVCSKKAGFKNDFGFQKPHSGNAYAGIYAYSYDDYREYIQGKLKETLTIDDTYLVSFYVNLADKSNFSIQDFDVLFSNNPFIAHNKRFIDSARVRADKLSLLEIKSKRFITDTINWTKLSITYKAKGFENFITLGNLTSNDKLTKSGISKRKKKNFSYYYIDDIAVEKIIIKPVFKPKKTYTFKHVLFDFDKAELLEVSTEELNKLSQHLSENKNLNIEIYGHTDNVGLEKRNQELSQERAKAVSAYLMVWIWRKQTFSKK